MQNLIKEFFPFESFRDQQLETIETIVDGLKRIPNFILESPTGVGKSVVGYTAGRVLNDINSSDESEPPIVILTSTKQLQKQYIESFSNHPDIEFIWAAKNYPCFDKSNDKEVHYGHSLCLKKNCMYINNCEYMIQKKKFFSSICGITNYHYFFNSKKIEPKILICDEAHNLESLLCEQASIEISSESIKFIIDKIKKAGVTDDLKIFIKTIKDLIKNPDLKIENDIIDYAKFYVTEFKKIYKKVTDLEIIANTKYHNNPKDTKAKSDMVNTDVASKLLKNSLEKFERFIKSKVQWIESEKDHIKNKIVIKPLEIYEYFNILLGSRTKYNIFMSATICGAKEFSRSLGINEYNYLETKAIIPSENRKIYACSFLNFNNTSKETVLPKSIKLVDRIIKYQFDKTKNVNGIIHSISYSNAEYVIKNSKFKEYMVIPTGKDLLNINKILKDDKNVIIVSPSILEGVDLIDDLSRFQIFVKVPFGFLGDLWVKTKMHKNNKWYARDAIVKIIQGSGRSIRSENDWAETFVLDSNFVRLLNKDKELFPKWFLEGIQIFNK